MSAALNDAGTPLRILLVPLVLCACTQSRLASKSDRHASDLAVYRAVLDSMSAAEGRHRPTQLVVIDSTFTGPLYDVDLSRLRGVDSAVVSDFREQNRESRSLKYLASSSALTVPIVLVSRNTLESFLRDGPEPYWEEFYRRYAGSIGSIGFSSIGYNDAGNVALVMVERSCATLCGYFSNVVVKRVRGRWRVTGIQITVVS